MTRERTESFEELKEKTGEGHELILFNDDINTFDFVIESLIDVCDHDPQSAEQCALVAHFNGKCAVREGELNELEPMSRALVDRGLSVAIN
jgi:ATP-dependent Clp protease adaptor protein ClpS